MQPFRNLLLEKDIEDIRFFLNKQEKFYPQDLKEFFNCSDNHVYRALKIIKKRESISTNYISRDVLSKYLIIK